MSRLGTIGRRSFLIGSAAVLGGVAFGVYRANAPFENPNLADLPDGAASFNPWVIVDRDGITLIAPHADKGQGVFSAQAAMIAEELDVGLDQVDVSFGVPDKAYFNGALSAAMVPFPQYDYGRIAQNARALAGGVVRAIMPTMGTGGSTAMPDSFDKLRMAGAIARETLKAAAAEQTGTPVSDLRTERGSVHLPDGTSLPYTELAETAARIEPITDVALRDPAEWRLLGTEMQRLDIVAKSTGTQVYGIDFEIEGMVHAAVRINPRKGGALNGYDAAEALEMRGVTEVIEITGGLAVIADNTWRAIAAANAIDCDWGAAPYPADQADHWAMLEAAFTDEKLNAEARAVGDVDAVDGARITAEYRSPYVAHAPLEPLAATVLVGEDRVDIWTGHQLQMFAVSMVADITGVDAGNVHLHNMFIGGSFGHRLEFDYLRQAAEIATKLRGTPVKLTYSREEDFAQDYPRHITMGRGTGVHKDGQVVALDLQIAGQSVMTSQMGRLGFSLPGPDTQLHEGAWDIPNFNLPNLRVRSYKETALAPVSS